MTEVAADDREYQATSSSPAAVVVRTGNIVLFARSGLVEDYRNRLYRLEEPSLASSRDVTERVVAGVVPHHADRAVLVADGQSRKIVGSEPVVARHRCCAERGNRFGDSGSRARAGSNRRKRQAAIKRGARQ